MAKCSCCVFIATALILCCLITSPCPADEIEYTFAGIGSGTIGTTTFSQEPFTINAFANTANASSFTGVETINDLTIYEALVPNDSASVTIATVGTFQFTYPGTTAVNNTFSGVSFSQPNAAQMILGQLGGGVSYVQSSSDFASWNLTSPLNTTTSMNNLYWGGQMETNGGLQPIRIDVDVETDGGTLFFNDSNSSTNSTFSATIVPEPSTLALLALGSLGLLVSRWFAAGSLD